MIEVLIKIALLYFLADFFTGLFHFLVDRFGSYDGPYMTKSVNLLLVHHDDPRQMLSQTYWEITGGVYKASVVIFGISLLFGFHWEVLAFLLLSANGNMIHKWSHQTKSETAGVVRLLQRTRIIQRPKHHFKHHDGSYNRNFCVMSNVMNPILHHLRFWEFLTVFLGLFKIRPVSR